MNKFYVTTPIYYVNDVPHIGHAYTTVAADVVARYWKAKLGDAEVLFLTGTDEHGAKIAQAAKDAGETPQEFVDKVAPQFAEVWKTLDINYSHFFRTTDPRHEEKVAEILTKLYDDGLIYKSVYKGLYCEGCEKFLTEEDLIDEKCPLHPNREPQQQEEDNYFFKLSQYKEELVRLFESGEVSISPEIRRNEILGKLRGELKDVSISRAGVAWGIPVPWDKEQTVYVWVEALFNYYTATQFLDNKASFWPTDVHLIGKDILWFHTVIWCALLKAAALPLPKKVFAHGFFTINGQKMSKSLGNVIAPQELVREFGSDATRYLLLSEFPFGQDGDFSLDKFRIRYNAELANSLGNLISRVATLCERNDIVVGKAGEYKFDELLDQAFDLLSLEGAISIIKQRVDSLNKTIDTHELWKNPKDKIAVFADVVEGIRELAFNLRPFMPEASKKIQEQFSASNIKSGSPLFPRIG